MRRMRGVRAGPIGPLCGCCFFPRLLQESFRVLYQLAHATSAATAITAAVAAAATVCVPLCLWHGACSL